MLWLSKDSLKELGDEAPTNSASCSGGLNLASLPETCCPAWGFHCFLAVADVVVGPCLLSGRPSALQYRDYPETFLTRLLESESPALGQGIWSQNDGAPVRNGEVFRQWLNAIWTGKRIWCRGSIAWPPLSLDLGRDGWFPVGTPEGARLCSLPRTLEDLMVRLKQLWQQFKPKCYDVFERVPCGALPSAFKLTEAAAHTYCNYEALIVWSFDHLHHLHHLTVMFIFGN
jgi:hypothetical protein